MNLNGPWGVLKPLSNPPSSYPKRSKIIIICFTLGESFWVTTLPYKYTLSELGKTGQVGIEENGVRGGVK